MLYPDHGRIAAPFRIGQGDIVEDHLGVGEQVDVHVALDVHLASHHLGGKVGNPPTIRIQINELEQGRGGDQNPADHQDDDENKLDRSLHDNLLGKRWR